MDDLTDATGGAVVYTQRIWSTREMQANPATSEWQRRWLFFKAKFFNFIWKDKKPEQSLEKLSVILWQLCATNKLDSIGDIGEVMAPAEGLFEATELFHSAFHAFRAEEPIYKACSTGLSVTHAVDFDSYIRSKGGVSLSSITAHFGAHAIIIWVFVTYLLLNEESRDDTKGQANLRLFSVNTAEWLGYVRDCLNFLEKSKFSQG